MTDQQLIEGLLSLGSELTIKGDPENAFVCTVAAARIMILPGQIEALRHPSGKVPDATTDDIERVIRYMYGKGLGEG